MHVVWNGLLTLLAGCVGCTAVMGSAVIFKWAFASGRVEHAYLTRDGYGCYYVYGHRSWRPPIVLGAFNTPEKATEHVERAGLTFTPR